MQHLFDAQWWVALFNDPALLRAGVFGAAGWIGSQIISLCVIILSLVLWNRLRQLWQLSVSIEELVGVTEADEVIAFYAINRKLTTLDEVIPRNASGKKVLRAGAKQARSSSQSGARVLSFSGNEAEYMADSLRLHIQPLFRSEGLVGITKANLTSLKVVLMAQPKSETTRGRLRVIFMQDDVFNTFVKSACMSPDLVSLSCQIRDPQPGMITEVKVTTQAHN